ncbi:hypothetical protein N7448_001064 [Penicillium atrosanguineum]|nr:hypothetical protein N7448_001064 [Penicillium atrosanguineum]
MPERRYSSGHQDERKTSSSPSRTQSTPRTQIREPRNLVFEYSLHYTGPVPIERTVALLAREAEDRKRGRSSHGHDRYRESQAQSHPPRSVEDRSYSNQLVRSKDQSHRAIRSQSDNRHSNGREGYHEGNRHHGQVCLSSQGHRNGFDPSTKHEHGAGWITTSDTLCDEISNYGEAELPSVPGHSLPRIERRGPDFYIVREARGCRHPRTQILNGGPRTSCQIL